MRLDNTLLSAVAALGLGVTAVFGTAGPAMAANSLTVIDGTLIGADEWVVVGTAIGVQVEQADCIAAGGTNAEVSVTAGGTAKAGPSRQTGLDATLTMVFTDLEPDTYEVVYRCLDDGDTELDVLNATVTLQDTGTGAGTGTGTGTGTGAGTGSGSVAPAPTITITPAEPTPGSTITITGTGFAPGEVVEFELHSDPISLGRTYTLDDGSLAFETTVPGTVPPGKHTLIASGVTSGIQIRQTVVIKAPVTTPAPSPILVPAGGTTGATGASSSATAGGGATTKTQGTGPGSLADTGVEGFSGLLIWAAVLAAGGTVAIVRARRV